LPLKIDDLPGCSYTLAYDEERQILEVVFNRTGVYTHYDVPPDVVEGLHQASSKGGYMRSMIIGMYHEDWSSRLVIFIKS
jgi:hypothetical protein